MRKSLKILSSLLLLFLFALLLISSVLAVELNVDREITLLSVSEMTDGSLKGDLAYLTLQVREGSGAVFLDSFPATRIDTQVSARMANEIACSYSDEDCSNYDFFYTIKAGAATIGGPSAGGAITLLTLSVLKEEPLKEKLAVTGAISSGGIIMPVDGIKEKISAAERNGYDLVIMPKLAISPIKNNITNYTLFQKPQLLEEDLKNFTIKIIEVVSLEDAFYAATKNNYVFEKKPELNVPKEYTNRMKLTADNLCERTEDLFNLTKGINNTNIDNAISFYNQSLNVDESQGHYSRASFCYSANTNLRIALLENYTQGLLLENMIRLNKSHHSFETDIDNYTLKTFSDLETYSIVKERLLESRLYLDSLNSTNISFEILALAIERYYSAVVWSGFFGMEGDVLDLNHLAVKSACEKELQSVYTRNNYLQTFMPSYLLQDLLLEISGVVNYVNQGEYELCLFKASKAKSYADYLISGATMVNDTIIELVDNKQRVARDLISVQEKNDVFPILGYSYYGYSQALEKDSYFSALMFAENAIAYSDLSNYFEKRSLPSKNVYIPYLNVRIFIAGMIVGLFFGFLLFKGRCAKRHRKKK